MNCTPLSFSISPLPIPVIVPFSRIVTAQAFVSSDTPNTGTNNASETVQVRPRPLARQGLPPKLP
jgi:hypothetical protein